MAQKFFPAMKDTVRAKNASEKYARDGGGEQHLLAGSASGFDYTSYVAFNMNWAGVKQISSAYLVLTTKTGAHTGFPTPSSGILISRMSSSFTDPNDTQPEGAFTKGTFVKEGKDTLHATNGVVGSGADQVTRINVTALVNDCAPKTVKTSTGAAGPAKPHYGWYIERRTAKAEANPRMCVGSSKAPNTNDQPFIELNFIPIASPNTISADGPTGNIPAVEGESFTGLFSVGASQPADLQLARINLELYLSGGTVPVWTYGAAASPSDVLTNSYTVPLSLVATTGSRYKLVSGQGYDWRAQALDNKGALTAWSVKSSFGLLTNPPVLSNPRPAAVPAMDTLNNVYFTADYSDPDGNPLLRYQVQLRTSTPQSDPGWGDDLLWDSGPVDGPGWVQNGNSPPAKPFVTTIKEPYGGIGLTPGAYSWRMRAWDNLEAPSNWVYSDVTLNLGFQPDPGSVDLLTGYAHRKLKARVLIKGMWNHVQTLVLVGATSGTFKLTFDGQTTSAIAWNATGPTVQAALIALSNLNAGDVVVTKGTTAWTFTFGGAYANRNVPKLTAGNYALAPATAYGNLFADRAPGLPVAIIEDASHIGASEMYNSGGEFYFSLPATHPQVSVIEPYLVHYALEHFSGESWREKAAGLITDFDASDHDVVFYGQDYLAILGRMVDERFNPTANADAAAVLWPAAGGGSKYVNRTITQIITDQLDRSIHDPGSPLAFFTRGTVDPMNESISIFVDFKERLPFIAGLIESHRAGTGLRTRLVAQKSATGQYSWVVKDGAGKDRPNFRLEYGGLVQGFRVLPFGAFNTRLNAIGRIYNQTKVEYYSTSGTPPAGQDASYFDETYGRFAAAQTYMDVTDLNDLKRRANQTVGKMTRVGKRLSLHLRPGALHIKDGWDIADSILVDIDRGVVSTMRMGSGYWTIWGWTWELSPDGKEDITLSILPKEDSSTADPDLIPSEPIDSTKGDWQIEARDPDPILDADVFTHVNSNTGHIFQRDTTSGLFVDRTTELPFAPVVMIDGSLNAERFTPTLKPVFVGDTLPPLPDPNYVPGHVASTPGSPALFMVSADAASWDPLPPGPPGPVGPPGPPGGADVTPPSVPTIKSTSSTTTGQADGTSITNLSAVIGYPSAPSLADLDQIVMQTTRWQLPAVTPPQPDWSLAASWAAPSSDKTGVLDTTVLQPTALSNTNYWVRAQAVDNSGNRSGWSAIVQVTTASDTTGPPQPSNIVVQSGMSTIGVRWDPIEVNDLDYVELRWRVSPAGPWTNVQVHGTMVVITGVTNDIAYDIQARSVDTSGNVLYDTGTVDGSGNAIFASAQADDQPESGWVTGPQGHPTTLPGSAFVWDSATIAHVFAGQINADWITAGTLRVGGAGGNAAAITVFDPTGHLIGRWSTAGIEVMDPTNTGYKLTITNAGLTITDGVAATPIVTMSPLGIDAASITFGSARGGHNLIQNSSFEMGKFGVTNIVNSTWDVAADWNAAGSRQGADANITTGATNLQMTTI